MRWSPVYLLVVTTLFGVVIHGVPALRHEQRSLDRWTTLERRAPVKNAPNKAKTAGNVALSAGAFKSSTYRKTAMTQGGNYDPLKKKVTPGGVSKAGAVKKDADHVFEAQSVAGTLKKHGITPTPMQKDKMKEALNDHANLVMVASKVNRAKGQFTRKVLRGKGKAASVDPDTHEYMKATKSQAMDTAQKLDKVMGQGTLFSDTQKEVHDAAGIKRRSVGLAL